MALLAQRQHGEVTFTERDTLSVLERPLLSSGVMRYDAPDHLEKQTLEPRASTLILDHGELTVTRGEHVYHFELSAYPKVAPYIDAILDTLAGNRAALERLFTIQLEGPLAHWRLTLRPLKRAKSPIRRIRIEGAEADIHTIGILQRDGDRSRITLAAPPAP